jgi:alpha-acetolactate decarboxylase
MRARFQASCLAAAAAGLLLLLGSGCATRAPHDQVTRWVSPSSVRPRTAFPAYHLRRYGDLAAGALARGGEMILNGLYYYQCTPDGAAVPLPPGEPLATGWSVRFRPDRVEILDPGYSLDKLDALLGVSVPDRSMACAFRLIGRFERLQLASGKSLQRVSGTLFGVRLPRDGQPGAELTLHFLSGDWLTGGRITAFSLIDGSLAIDLCPRYLQINAASGPALEHLRR